MPNTARGNTRQKRFHNRIFIFFRGVVQKQLLKFAYKERQKTKKTYRLLDKCLKLHGGLGRIDLPEVDHVVLGKLVTGLITHDFYELADYRFCLSFACLPPVIL